MNVIDCLPLRPGIEKYDPINNGDPAYTHPTAPGILFRTINLENYDKDSFSEASSSKEPLAFVERARELHAELPFLA